ncbi:RING/U-box superfamily protein [Tasmannia lanceolata]|uniref:RING/U-box superfamily protein n=1 Tax=Tasmannia lanceolata TaxID=3420 RepID=UPI004063902E
MIKDTSSSSKGSNPCPICLQSLNQEAYLDRCFHTFCYNCISHWAKLVSGKHYHSNSSIHCPLCKRENFSIIHGCDGDSFQQHYINQDKGGFTFSESHRYRLQCYCSEPAIVIYQKFDVLQYWRCHRYLQPNRWLQRWLKREIQALIQEEDVDIIVHHIHGVVESFLRRNKREHMKGVPEQKQEEFRALISDAAGPFLFGRTERFVNEVELFLASGLTIEAYDKVYLQCLGSDTYVETSENAEEIHDQTPQVAYLNLFYEETDITD